jgi:hypothetical protein
LFFASFFILLCLLKKESNNKMKLISQLEKGMAFLTGLFTTRRLSGIEGALQAVKFLAGELAAARYSFA